MIELHNKDCFEVMAQIESGTIDLIVTDPPYYSTNLHFDKAPRIDFELWLKECQRILKPSGVLVSFADFNLLADLRSKKVFKSSYELIWHKTIAVGFLQANLRPLMTHEFIGVFVDGLKSGTFNPQKTKGKAYVKKNKNNEKGAIYSTVYGQYKRENNGFRNPVTIVKFSNNHKNQIIHPTQKPVDLLQWLIKSYSNEGETVFDGFAGSGSTGVACIHTKRNFIGCELHPPYFDAAQKRLLDAKHDLIGLFT